MWNSQVCAIPRFSLIAKKGVLVQITLHFPQDTLWVVKGASKRIVFLCTTSFWLQADFFV